jgi:putative two-component system response regulator
MSSTHVEALEVLLRSHANVDNPDLKVVLTRLSAEIHNRLTGGSATSVGFVEASVRALCRIKGTAHASLVMDCLSDSAQFLYSNGRSSGALVAAARCEQLAKRNTNQEWLAKSQNLLGILHAELGNIGQAVILYSKALDSARSSRDLARELAVLNCLGVAFNYGGLYRQALPCFDRVLALGKGDEFIRLATQLGPLGSEYVRGALTNKAQSHLQLEEFSEGFDAIDQCLKESPEPWDAVSAERRAIREVTYVRLALELGKLATARAHVAEAGRVSLRATGRARFYYEVTACLCRVHGGDPDEGLQRLEELLSMCHSSAERTTILTDLIRSYDQMGKPEAALEKVAELMAHLQTMRQEGLAAVLSLGVPVPRSTLETASKLDPLTVRAAVLRARVAERRLAIERAETFERLAIAADLKEEDSGRHGYRVGKLSALVAERLQWPQQSISAIEVAGRLHDIGKIAVPDRILLSLQQLGDVERRWMTAHTTIGSELLSKSDLPQLRIAEEIARHHHEWWDGNGYPSKLAGKRIPIHARIVALADVFDALTHGRPYAPAWSIDQAIEEIRSRRGTQFDPDLTDTFLALVADLRRAHPDLDAFLAEASRNSPFLQARDKIRRMLDGERQAEKIAATAAETVH